MSETEKEVVHLLRQDLIRRHSDALHKLYNPNCRICKYLDRLKKEEPNGK